jgi:hypothetical protein
MRRLWAAVAAIVMGFAIGGLPVTAASPTPPDVLKPSQAAPSSSPASGGTEPLTSSAVPGPPGSAAPAIGPDDFVAAVCAAVDELLTAIGNPDTGDQSGLYRSFESAIEAGDLLAVDAVSTAILAHLDVAQAQTERAAGFGPATDAFDHLVVFLGVIIDSVEAMRDAAPEGLDAARAAGQQVADAAYEPWTAWMREMGPVWATYAGDMPVPCPAPSAKPMG